MLLYYHCNSIDGDGDDDDDDITTTIMMMTATTTMMTTTTTMMMIALDRDALPVPSGSGGPCCLIFLVL